MKDKMQIASRTLPIITILFAALMLAVLLPLRIWQQLNLVEPGTGFWLGKGITVVLLYVGMGVLIAVSVCAAFLMKRRTAVDLTRKRRIIEGVFAALLALALLWDAIAAAQYAMQLFLEMGDAASNGLDPTGASNTQHYTPSGALTSMLECVFGVLSALLFGDLALMDFTPKKNRYLKRLMTLAPLIWAVCRILRRFSRTIAYLRVSDLFIGLCMLVMLAFFFLAFAQILNDYNGKNKQSRLFGMGIPAAVLGLICFVPRVVAYIFNNAEPPQDALIEWCDLAMSMFLFVFIAGRVFEVPPRPKDKLQDSEELQESEPVRAEIQAEED